jgi:hypothetical protein
MRRLSLHSAQEKCQWLAIAASLVIATTTVGITLLWSSDSQALAPSGDTERSSLFGEYTSPHHCRECHNSEFQAWSNTTHAQASFDPVFQVSLQQVAEPGECFSCHTTGYDSATGQFVLSGVTCEACHGPYRAEHPQESMRVAASEELCGTCHTGTLSEWAASHHSEAGVSCTDCHEVHAQKTRASSVANALCAGCHQETTQDQVHVIHQYEETGIYCIECHLARPDTDASDKVKGQIITGHSFIVPASTCADCHPMPLPADTDIP